MASRKITFLEALVKALRGASWHSQEQVKPVAVLWPDAAKEWEPLLPELRKLLPELLLWGDYAPSQSTGPAIWLRCMVERVLTPALPPERVPVIYLPGVALRELADVATCRKDLLPLVELQYRGTCWAQAGKKDWTVESFLGLAATDGGLGLQVASDKATREVLSSSLSRLSMATVEELRERSWDNRSLVDFLSDDPARDLLSWISDAQGFQSNCENWKAFCMLCEKRFKFSPEKDGVLVAAEKLGRRGKKLGRRGKVWKNVWDRFAQTPSSYQGVPDLLAKVKPDELFADPSSWPQENERQEKELRQELRDLTGPASTARERLLALEEKHGPRRDWVWERLQRADLALSLKWLALLARRTEKKLGGASLSDMVVSYVSEAWEADRAALQAMAVVRSAQDEAAVRQALDVVYAPWLAAAAEHFQELFLESPPAGEPGEVIEEGGVLLFVDGLRFDIAKSLAAELQELSWDVVLVRRYSTVPTVTATAKPAVSPVAEKLGGGALNADFQPSLREGGKTLNVDLFRKHLKELGYQVLLEGETGDITGRAWTESGKLDHLGHTNVEKLPSLIEEELARLRQRMEALLEAGWREIHVVTDHGWLWLPGKLPKTGLPKRLTSARWARCAAVEEGAKVKVPVAPWSWNAQEYVALAPGISCFKKGYQYAHGGLSLQESVVPLLRVTGRADVRGMEVVELRWRRMRCRVRVTPPQAGLAVDLRLVAEDPTTSRCASRLGQLDDQGKASLLVEDDSLEGEEAVLVVLDERGHVAAMRKTRVAQED